MALMVGLLRGHVHQYPTPLALNLNWNHGILTALVLVGQVSSGLILACVYSTEPTLTFHALHSIQRHEYLLG